MINQYFGQYLFNKGILTAEQLFDVLAHERLVRVKLGVLAINAEVMTANQVEEIHQLQRHKDKLFGELAIENGYLTHTQLEELLEGQRLRQLSLSQAIIDQGYLNLAQLEQALADYRQENHISNDQWQQSLNIVDYTQIVRLFLDLKAAGALEEVYYDYIGLLMRNIMRFLNEYPVVDESQPFDGVVNNWLVSQYINGEISLFTGLAMDDATLLELARGYSGEHLNVLDELAKDSVTEFLNVVNGVFCVNASNQGADLDLEPQTIVQCSELTLENSYCIPVKLPFGTVNLILAAGKA
jgi:CheY-specific phosphatase CheX